MKRKVAGLLVMILLCSLLLAGCTGKTGEVGEEGRADKTTLIVSHFENPGSFNPDWKADDPAY
ncbi:MAG TPA: ABC transporter substrate-binding protein, partial [Firmicutes bacterium]|nr:ABC transporter substrate-binding protein [Bacillota bacterium]